VRDSLKRLRSSSLCRRDTPASTARDVIGWWESRRIPFNLIVGSAGILSCLSMGVIGLARFFLIGGDADFPAPTGFALFGIIVYAIGANLCFTAGWIVELGIRWFSPEEADRFASLSFSTGLVFSVLLTLTPGILAAAIGIFALLGHVRGVVHNPL
jgi:hypothetical protein